MLTLSIVTLIWAAGLLVGYRTRRAEAADRRAKQVEQDRHADAARAVSEDRARIARELHDVVSHGLSVIILQTMAARAELHDGGGGDRHLDAVETTARESLGEMRRMLGLLQPGDLSGSDLDRPVPGLAALPALLDRASAAGVRIDSVELTGTAEVPSGLELSIFRVVQESLTNIVKHAPGARVRLAIQVTNGVARVSVASGCGREPSAPPAGAGQGLIGMHQRVALYGGTLSAAPTPSGWFVVAATFPFADAPEAVR